MNLNSMINADIYIYISIYDYIIYRYTYSKSHEYLGGIPLVGSIVLSGAGRRAARGAKAAATDAQAPWISRAGFTAEPGSH